MGELTKPGMILRSSRTSPFGRKVRIVAARLGLDDCMALVEPSLMDPADPLRQDNPLGKIPCLVLEDGSAVFDSAVIIDHLDRSSGGNLLPADPAQRTRMLVRQALADGLADAAIALGAERMFRPEEHVSERWLDHQRGKVERALAAFVAEPPVLSPVGIDAISLACALGYLEWRKPVAWREDFPELAIWLDRFAAAVPEFGQTQA